MPIFNLQIKKDNLQAHLDIEKEMLKHKNSWYHFEVRYSGGNIVDFVIREFISYEEFKPGQDAVSYAH